jgi:hypothetical protein
MRRPLAAAVLLLALPAASEPPAALFEATEAAATHCIAAGGEPAILDGYRVTRDLNGDGRDDFLTDLARLECRGAWSAFCGSSGCPVTAWLSEPGGGHSRFELGRLLGFELRDGEPLPALVARYAAPLCGGETIEECTRTWAFASNSPETPPIDPRPKAEEPAEPEPEPEAVEPAAPAFPAPDAGWSLRRVPGSSPVALGAGIGNIASLAAFCLGGEPFLAVTFHQRPEDEDTVLGFAFSEGAVEVSAGFEETAGGAFVVALADGPLATRLAGRDSEVEVSVDGAAQGTLSLDGSTRAIRGALEACGGP